MGLKDWYRRHRWLFVARPEVDGQPDPHDPATDPFRYGALAERTYEARGHLGDKEVRPDQLDIE